MFCSIFIYMFIKKENLNNINDMEKVWKKSI